MPVQSRRQGDDLLVDNVDIKRAARNFLSKTRDPGWTPPADLNQAMELMATCFGYANLLAANKQAQSPEFLSTLVYQPLKPSPSAAVDDARIVAAHSIPEPRVVVYQADDRFEEEAAASAMTKARLVEEGSRVLELDMSGVEAITTLRQFRKLEKPNVVVCSHIELGPNSASSSELLHVMVNYPSVEFRLVFRTLHDAAIFFSTWVYPDDSPAISKFEADLVYKGQPRRRVIRTKAYDPADTRYTRRMVDYPEPFRGASRATRTADQELAGRLMTARRDGRQMMLIGVGLDDLTIRGAGPDNIQDVGPDDAPASRER